MNTWSSKCCLSPPGQSLHWPVDAGCKPPDDRVPDDDDDDVMLSITAANPLVGR